MIILNEASGIQKAQIGVSSEHKKDPATNRGFGYLSLEYKVNGVKQKARFSFDAKTGVVNFTGEPWDWIKSEIAKRPYTSDEKDFMTLHAKSYARFVKGARSCFFNGTKWSLGYGSLDEAALKNKSKITADIVNQYSMLVSVNPINSTFSYNLRDQALSQEIAIPFIENPAYPYMFILRPDKQEEFEQLCKKYCTRSSSGWFTVSRRPSSIAVGKKVYLV